jgi:hypothetical protein
MQTHFGRWRSGDGWLDGQRRRGTVKLRGGQGQRGPRGYRAGCPRSGRVQHGRVADIAGRAGGRVVIVRGAAGGSAVVACAPVCGCGCYRRRVVIVAMFMPMATLWLGGHLWGRRAGEGVLRAGNGLARACWGTGRTAMVVRLGLLFLRVPVLRAWGQQRRQDASGHGGAREAPKDQHHHQQHGKAATHP